jgi:hypothetical protein
MTDQLAIVEHAEHWGTGLAALHKSRPDQLFLNSSPPALPSMPDMSLEVRQDRGARSGLGLMGFVGWWRKRRAEAAA